MMVLLRLLLVPALVAGVTLAVRRWGPAVGGWLAGLPIVAGPILVFYALEQGSRFAAAASAATLAGLIGTVAFAIAYAGGAARLPWYACMIIGWTVYAAMIVALHALRPALSVSFVVLVAATLFGRAMLRRVRSAEPGLRTEAPEPGLRTEAPEPGLRTEAAEPGLRTEAAEPGLRTEAPEPGLRTEPAEPGLRTEAAEPGLRTEAPEPGLRTEAPEPGLLRTGATEPGLRTEAAEPGLRTRAAEPGLRTRAAEPGPSHAYVGRVPPKADPPGLPTDAYVGRVPPRDLITRVIATATLVLVLTGLAARLGPAWSGLLSAFPVLTTIVAVFSHTQRGAAAVVAFLNGYLEAIVGFGLFCLVMARTIERVGLGWSLIAALAAQLGWHAVLVYRSTKAATVVHS
jgi:hypothetical protein